MDLGGLFRRRCLGNCTIKTTQIGDSIPIRECSVCGYYGVVTGRDAGARMDERAAYDMLCRSVEKYAGKPARMCEIPDADYCRAMLQIRYGKFLYVPGARVRIDMVTREVFGIPTDSAGVNQSDRVVWVLDS